MSHYAMTEEEVQVCDWTGEVPRAGEVIVASGRDCNDYRGKWYVTRVTWLTNVNITGPVSAQVTVEPACGASTAWLLSKGGYR
jgi:hypothetical protein